MMSLIIPPPSTKQALLKNPATSLMPTRAVSDGAMAVAMLDARNTIFVAFVAIRRPYSSDSGPQRRGPGAYPATKILIIRAAIVSELLPNSLRTERKAGASITAERGLFFSSRGYTIVRQNCDDS